jgi:hypothetical protein
VDEQIGAADEPAELIEGGGIGAQLVVGDVGEVVPPRRMRKPRVVEGCCTRSESSSVPLPSGTGRVSSACTVMQAAKSSCGTGK